MKEQRLLCNTYLYLHFCIWVLCYPTAVWCVYQRVRHHAVVATCLSTANWEVARVLCNGCCVYTRMYIQCGGACSVYIVVWGLGLCTYGGHTTVQYIVQCYMHTVYVCTLCNSTCALCNSRCALCNSTHALCNSSQIFLRKLHRYIVRRYVRIYVYSYGFLLYMM